jgi:hypothetical protein
VSKGTLGWGMGELCREGHFGEKHEDFVQSLETSAVGRANPCSKLSPAAVWVVYFPQRPQL